MVGHMEAVSGYANGKGGKATGHNAYTMTRLLPTGCLCEEMSKDNSQT